MSFWKPTRSNSEGNRSSKSKDPKSEKRTHRRSPPVAFEAKALAVEAVNSGADRTDAPVKIFCGFFSCPVIFSVRSFHL